MQHTNRHTSDLLLRCKNGEQSAQFEIYKNYYKAMYNTALRILNNSFEAEDMMQESFLIAFTKLGTFKGEVTFGSWLKRIVINKCLTQLKKNNRFEEVKLEVQREEMTDEDLPHGIEMKPEVILNAINGLKNNYRVALNLHLIEGYDYEEISEIMDITYENSRTTISRAKRKLRTVLTTQFV